MIAARRAMGLRPTHALLAAVVWCGGCGELGPVAPAPPRPEILSIAVAANPTSVLAARVRVHVRGGERVGVRYHVRGAASSADSVAPAVAIAGDSADVPVFGLLPRTPYVLRAVASAGADSARSDSVMFTTDSLPSDLPRYVATGADPSPGYVVFAAGNYGVAIDNTGRVVWYHRFTDGPGLNFMVLPNGRYAARPTTPDPTDLDPWVEVDPAGTTMRTFGCAGSLEPRFHDLIADADGGYWIMCDLVRAMDLSAVGGVAGARVTGTVVQHVGATGTLLFEWSPFDHFDITDVDAASRTGTMVNWTHGNAIDLDADGNLLVSFRSLNEITKIDISTGDVMWRLGGLRNQFTFVDTPVPAFARQHGLRGGGPGVFVLLDNAGDPAQTRAERYAIDQDTRTARLVQSYAVTPASKASLGGSTQSLAGGRTLVAYGNGNAVAEFDAAGTVVWRIDGDAGYVFRATRIRSLYNPGLGLLR